MGRNKNAVHVLISTDPETSKGTCKNCGDVDIWLHKQRMHWICMEAYRERGRRTARLMTERRKELRMKMLQEQGFKCGVCEVPIEDGDVDHCHDSDHIRAILCGPCNKGLGQFKDNVDVMRKAIAYLEMQAQRTDNRYKYSDYMRRNSKTAWLDHWS